MLLMLESDQYMSKYSHIILAYRSAKDGIVNIGLNPRKTPLQARARVTHDAILESAAQILSKSGLSGFNTNAVAERAGVSIGSLYQYFPNKDALMVALIHRQQQTQLRSVALAVLAVADGDLETVIRAMVKAAMQHHHDDSLLASAIDHEEARLPIATELNHYLDQGGEMLRLLLAKFSGEIGSVDIDQAIKTLPVMVRAIVDAWANQTPPRLDIAEDQATRAVLGYLQAP
jgi:AcrR family transcriptional regulator